jgi:hypothetical protein
MLLTTLEKKATTVPFSPDEGAGRSLISILSFTFPTRHPMV